ncbi:ABC transporter permease [Roseibium aquae]|uniref:ABC transporter permease n=1 Tax=Roseibium aquae TaxID=1323746 RepID=A0A916TLC0_9HYPH|nr:ABC transporter permease [Roseibium aquae]GGB56033.1 ABC transporter permease [Roseibium aquae]
MTETIMQQCAGAPQDMPVRRGAARRQLVRRGAVVAGILALVTAAPFLPLDPLHLNPAARGLGPSLAAPFGTDLLGRDVLARTLTALAVSAQVGLAAAAISTLIAVTLALAATFSRLAERAVGVLTELALGLPHFVLVLMVAYAAGGGMSGVILGVALTHWPRLCRVLRHEAQTVAAADYVRISRALGRSRFWVARYHLAPHLLPQVVVGFVLIFPHAILHEAGLSFIGLGIEPHLPSIGVMLADSLRGLMAGHWWVAVFPGLGLVFLALSFEVFGESLRRAADPVDGGA